MGGQVTAAMSRAASALGNARGAQAGGANQAAQDGDGQAKTGIARFAGQFAGMRTNGMGVFSDRRLKTALSIGRYAKKGRDGKGRETVNLGTFAGDARPAKGAPGV